VVNPHLISIRCLECNHELAADDVLSAVCPNCGSGWLDATYEYDAVSALWKNGIHSHENSLWRYGALLPILPTEPDISMGEGWTPFQRLRQYERIYQHSGKIYVKDERAQPTNSFKDRQAALSVMAMKQRGIMECVLASTGNAAVAYAAYCARAGIKLWLFLTSLVPPEKMREAALYGCEVVKVSGTYDEAKRVAAEFAQHKGIHLDRGAKAVPGKESMKTLAFEIAEQLGLQENPDSSGQWLAPDWYIQAVSGGIGPLGVWKGFSELKQMGLIDKMPKLGIIQSAGCSPMVNAFLAGKEEAEPVVPQSLIHVLATGSPGLAYQLLREACLSNGGTMLAIEDGEAFTAMRNIASKGGLSVEPATAVAFAGLEKMLQDGTIQKTEIVAINCSGHTFPVESHILHDQYDRYVLDLKLQDVSHPASEGLGAAIQNLDEQITTIVVVDDNPQDRRLIRRLLKTYKPYRVYEADNGQHGLEVIRDRKPDLIITDLTMPVMDGFQLLEILKQDPATATIPVIVASAKTLTANDQKRLESQAQSVWTKGGGNTAKLVEKVVTTLGHAPIGIIHQPNAFVDPNLADRDTTLERSTHTIVVVDDNPLDLRLARRILKSADGQYNIIEANTGEDGLRAIRDHHPELVILDLTLPDMDGYAVIEKLQEDEALREIPIVVYSARELKEEEREKLEKHIRSVLYKASTNRQQFLDIIEDELG